MAEQDYKLLLTALRQPEAIGNLDSEELDLLIRLARQARLHGRIAADLDRIGSLQDLPDVARDQFESALVMARAREHVARWELDRIEWALLEGPEVTLICLKGAAYMLLGIPAMSGRIFADVDLLVSKEHLEVTERFLNRKGWETQQLTPYDDNYYRRWTHELPPLVHLEREVEVDLHHNIVPNTARLKPPSKEILEMVVTLPDSSYRVPSDCDMVLHAIVHLVFDSDMVDKLRDLVDIQDLLTHFSAADDSFWNRLVERTRQLGLQRPAFYGLRYVNQILGDTAPHSILHRIESWGPVAPVRRLMDGMVPRALLPPNDGEPTALTSLCRQFMYMRSHWLRMPPWLLAYHLSVKFVRRHFVPTA